MATSTRGRALAGDEMVRRELCLDGAITTSEPEYFPTDDDAVPPGDIANERALAGSAIRAHVTSRRPARSRSTAGGPILIEQGCRGQIKAMARGGTIRCSAAPSPKSASATRCSTSRGRETRYVGRTEARKTLPIYDAAMRYTPMARRW